MHRDVMQRLTLATALVRQFDGLIQEEIGARYTFEMARSRPQQSPEVVRDTAQYEVRLKTTQTQLIHMEKMVERITGLTVGALRRTVDDLAVVVSRREEVEGELRNRRLLTPALVASIQYACQSEGRDATTEEVDALEAMEQAVAEVNTLEQNSLLLAERAEQIAATIQYNDPSSIQIVASLAP